MGFADKFKGVMDKAKGYAQQNTEKVDQAVDKAGDFVDQKTEGKYADKVDKAQESVKNKLSE